MVGMRKPLFEIYQPPPWIRFLILDPITGALIGILHALVGAVIWMLSGQPDFYFRGFSGVQVYSLAESIGGFAVGIPYGFLLMFLERVSSRKLELSRFLFRILLIAGVFFTVITIYQFIRREILSPFYPCFTVAALAIMIAMYELLARRRE